MKLTPTFTIVGGGIAGLTTTIALYNIGVNPIIFEAAPEIKAIGAGIALGENAIKAFQQLGLAEEVMQLGHFLPTFTIYDQKGKAITQIGSAKATKKQRLDNFVIHRAALHQLLLSKLPAATVHTNKRVVNVEQNEKAVTIRFQDGSIHKTDFLIAADGIHSQIRKHLLPQLTSRYAGYTCWRAIIDNKKLNLTEGFETWGKAGRFGISPLKEDKLYWFACLNSPQNDKRMQHFKVADLQENFKGFHAPIPAVLAATANEDLIWNDIIDLKPLSRFAYEKIVLIGDAAHATTPNMGQGACQAIEDAVILAKELEGKKDIVAAFKQFEQKRIKRTHYIVKNSWKLGKVAQIENPALIALRNWIFRLVPPVVQEKQLEFLSKVDF